MLIYVVSMYAVDTQDCDVGSERVKVEVFQSMENRIANVLM